MNTLFVDSSETYDGSQLVSLHNYLRHGIIGDSAVAWIGPCNVAREHMVDGEDLLAGAEIRGAKMAHFIVELFDSTLFAAVALQRLFTSIALDVLREISTKKELVGELRRDGDDIFCGERKFSISIATKSPITSLIHFAVNVVNEGTPIKTISLQEFEIDGRRYAEEILKRLAMEVVAIRQATRKVRWVK